MAEKTAAPKSTAEALKAGGIPVGKTDLFMFPPEHLTLIVDEDHPLFDERVHEAPIDELVVDIGAQGVHTPILVRKNGMKADGKTPIVEVVDGRRRVINALEWNRRVVSGEAEGVSVRIPAVMLRGNDGAAALASLSRNSHRKDESHRNRSRKIVNAMKFGATKAELIRATGHAEKHINLLINFADLEPEVQKALDSGEFPIGSVADFMTLSRKDQIALLRRMRKEGVTKKHEIKEHAAAVREKREPRKLGRKAIDRSKIEAIANSLRKEYGEMAALLDFTLGDKEALEPFPELRESVVKPLAEV